MSRPFVRKAALAALVVASLSCDESNGIAGPGVHGIGVDGAVARVKTGAGVPNVVVVAMRGGEIVGTTHTDVGGSFSLELPEGAYTVRLTGLELSDVDLQATAFDPIEQPATVGGSPTPLVFAAVGLVPSRVTGDVSCAGVPVEGARLRVVGGAGTDEEVLTDARGRYAAADVGEGAYTVIPLEAPCTITPAFGVVHVGKGQAGEVDFEGS